MALLLALGATALLVGCARASAPEGEGVTATLVHGGDDARVCLLVADDAEERREGLSGVGTLEPFDGMLFVFDEVGNYEFWMKDTLIPLDLVVVRTNGELAEPIAMQPCPPGTVCARYRPDEPYRRALEFEVGRLEELDMVPTEAGTVSLELGDERCP